MKKSNIIKLSIWLIICGAVLSVPLQDIHNKEAHIIYGLLMLGITFPLGYIFAMSIAFIGFSLDKCCGISLPSNEIMLIPTWVGFVVVGYLQWFVFIPWAFRIIKRKLNGT